MKKRILLAAMLGVLLMVAPVWAATVISPYAGLVTLDVQPDTSYAGFSDSPWTIFETFTAVAAGDLRFSSETGSPVGPSNTTGTLQSYGKWIQKTVTNNTGSTWTSFEIELQSDYGQPSVDGDGLSFAQVGVSLSHLTNLPRIPE